MAEGPAITIDLTSAAEAGGSNEQAALASQYQAGLLALLAPYQAYLSGQAGADVLVVKGHPHAAENNGGKPFSGQDGTALEAILQALGWGEQNWCGVLLKPAGEPPLPPAGFRMVIETNDPLLVMALDGSALQALQAAMADGQLPEQSKPTPIGAGEGSVAMGRRILLIEGFVDSLADPSAKQQVWAKLKLEARPAP